MCSLKEKASKHSTNNSFVETHNIFMNHIADGNRLINNYRTEESSIGGQKNFHNLASEKHQLRGPGM